MVITLIIMSLGCKKEFPVVPDDNWKLDSRIKQITFYGQEGYNIPAGNARFPYFNNNIGGISYIKRVFPDTLQNNNQGLWSLDTTQLNPTSILEGKFDYLCKSRLSNEYILIRNLKYPNSGDLILFNSENQILSPINLELNAIYGATFCDYDSSLIIYGDKTNITNSRGYYKYHRNNNTLEFLFSEPRGLYGFDVSPDNKYLIYPVAPKYLILNLETGIIDTGKVYAEWLKFSPDGKKILYSSNTIDLYSESEAGIFDFVTDQLLNLNIDLINPAFGDTFIGELSWSENGSQIIFSGVPQATKGVPGPIGYINIYTYYIK